MTLVSTGTTVGSYRDLLDELRCPRGCHDVLVVREQRRLSA
jgi:hypothetical protein